MIRTSWLVMRTSCSPRSASNHSSAGQGGLAFESDGAIAGAGVDQASGREETARDVGRFFMGYAHDRSMPDRDKIMRLWRHEVIKGPVRDFFGDLHGRFGGPAAFGFRTPTALALLPTGRPRGV